MKKKAVKKEKIGTLVRDLTKVGSIPKSEATRRITCLIFQALEEQEERFSKKVNAVEKRKFALGKRLWCADCVRRIRKEILTR